MTLIATMICQSSLLAGAMLGMPDDGQATAHAGDVADRSVTAFHTPVRLKAGDEYINVDIGHAAPFMHDVTGNGVRDLLVGQFGQGRLRIYENVGTNEEPKFEGYEYFKAGHEYGTVPAG